MALTLKVKYFNTFVLREKPVKTIVTTTGRTTGTTVNIDSNTVMATGQIITGPGIEDEITITRNSNTQFTLSSAVTLEKGVSLTLYSSTPYSGHTPNKEWHVEESRIKGKYSEQSIDLGAKAYLEDKNSDRKHRENALIYSGVLNKRTAVNKTNEFSIAENITKAVDIAYGSIQKLYAEDTNLTIFQENKVSRALIDKDAIYTAEGGQLTIAGAKVIGQITPYSGEYGISKNPESFAKYGYQKYFTDKNKGVVLRLSRDGITEISSYGMKGFFRDKLKQATSIYGMYDIHNKSYVLSMETPTFMDQIETTFDQPKSNSEEALVAITTNGKTVYSSAYNHGFRAGDELIINGIRSGATIVSLVRTGLFLNKSINVTKGDILTVARGQFRTYTQTPTANYKTLSFDERVNGWTSFFTYGPKFGGSVGPNFYTWNKGNLYQHYLPSSVKNTFYGEYAPSSIKIISNQNPSLVKHYKSVNYEGTKNWKVISLKSPATDDNFNRAYPIPGNITGREVKDDKIMYHGFAPLEKKYYGRIIKNNNDYQVKGIEDLKSSGISGFFTEAILEHHPVNNLGELSVNEHAELFSVGFNYEKSLY